MSTVKSISQSESEIRKASEEWAAAVRNRDIDSLMSHYAEDVTVFDVPPPLAVSGRENYRKNWEHWLGSIPGEIGCDMRDVRVIAEGDLGFLHCLTRIGSRKANGDIEGAWVRVTVCFRKIAGRWLTVHEHVSLPFNGQTSVVDLQPQ